MSEQAQSEVETEHAIPPLIDGEDGDLSMIRWLMSMTVSEKPARMLC